MSSSFKATLAFNLGFSEGFSCVFSAGHSVSQSRVRGAGTPSKICSVCRISILPLYALHEEWIRIYHFQMKELENFLGRGLTLMTPCL